MPNIPILYTDASRDLHNMWAPFGHEVRVLPKGWVKDPGRRPLAQDTVWEKDVAITLRDGTTLYSDVFRPVGHTAVPAILPWSPYGKSGTGYFTMDTIPHRVGVPRDRTSGLEKFEAPDPAEWVPRGYAVVNVDARGPYNSEGDIVHFGTQEGRDGKNKREDVNAMLERYPLWNGYWEDKKPKLEKITQPIYATMSYSSGLHTEGSLRGFLLSSSKDKWLRCCPTQEWYDLYQQEHVDDLQHFFDRYLKGIDNGWEATPRIRLSLLGYNRPNVIDRATPTYPPPNFAPTRLYLDATHDTLSRRAPAAPGTATYDAEQRAGRGVRFAHRFDARTELCGLSRATLFMSTPDHDDMDVFVVIRKLDAAGSALESFNIPFRDAPAGWTEADVPPNNIWRYVGPNGRLRASMRRTEDEPGLSEEQRALLGEASVYHPFDRVEKVGRDEVVRLDIGLWAGGMVFDEGEYMSFEVKGFLPIRPEFEGLDDKMVNYNKGRHRVHSGGEHPSSLLVWLSG
ncbi:putative x-pro dipeptidyl-peptidase c-terminal non-catalytic domain-containing protein [Neofusicoccum parvum UCRNP2]|uniref:Putative x-pro dipeptidyl-peptidase c-terminal non-catalytic domain-containing protein n=1 Tax=Botryosphaeria parva (strain UCR-NP2) TaxID=1287680 RepID=R1GCN8_BOTPV|nr:putative x-pro dipeptidyl-peptidase c-terminal non-catalytic domain-containing protein [Neofusicoccum parvum UCRNP2]